MHLNEEMFLRLQMLCLLLMISGFAAAAPSVEFAGDHAFCCEPVLLGAPGDGTSGDGGEDSPIGRRFRLRPDARRGVSASAAVPAALPDEAWREPVRVRLSFRGPKPVFIQPASPFRSAILFRGPPAPRL